MTAKLPASSSRASGAPTVATISPATAGPAMPASSQLAERSELAASSSSSSTRRGTRDDSATSVTADSSALTAAIPYRSATARRCCHSRTGTAAISRPRAALSAASISRGRVPSSSRPATGPLTIRGSPKHMRTRPSWAGPAMPSTTQESATKVKASPAREIIIPSQNRRNARRRSTCRPRWSVWDILLTPRVTVPL